MFNVLVCEDDRNIRQLMCEYLNQDGYCAYQKENGRDALELLVLEKVQIDLLITDIMMPIMDGFELTAKIRSDHMDIPILMITAKGATEDKRVGFASGADDYMVKPIDMDEMLLRVSALLRRAKPAMNRQLTVGDTVLDADDFSVTVKGQKKLQLPNKEFQILYKLLSRKNQIFTRTQIMDDIWGYGNESTVRTVDVHIRRLREKFESNPDFEIVTVKGLGYRAVAP